MTTYARGPDNANVDRCCRRKRCQQCYKCRTMVELLVECYHVLCTQWDEGRLLLNIQAMDAPANRIEMLEDEEVPEADPAVHILNDFNFRMVTVAGGFAINNDGIEPSDEGGSSIGHQWQLVDGYMSAIAALKAVLDSDTVDVDSKI
ncbi:hypothetical protein K505DRAFT_339783 [Melanomma pulvis-pyrius CBS 109.77]|uniref:Uncharacterized protein n=1 Tax=Melanomma pulvis-pyrius CBS 109.77 TaxID=1314802 RepID=A0A6A6X4T6_9PLEO|nr:hypothetical protein K505DRAFT_339783 [Melanomma pulvis-pyrius CBS 109.77]